MKRQKIVAVILVLALAFTMSGCTLLDKVTDTLGLDLDFNFKNPLAGLFGGTSWSDPVVEQSVREYLGLGENEKITEEQLEDISGIYIYSQTGDYETYYYEVAFYSLEATEAIMELILLDDDSDANYEILENGTTVVSFDTTEVFTTLSDFKNFPNLKSLTLTDIGLSDIRNLADCKNLELLWLDDNSIVDISPLTSLKKLRFLSLWNNQIRDVSSLEDMTTLQYLDLEGNEVIDYSPLYGLSGLEILYVDVDSMTDSELESLVFALPNCNI